MALLPYLQNKADALNEAERILTQVNWTGSGSLNYNEWFMGTSDQAQLIKKKNLRLVFKFLDRNKTGFIGSEDFTDFL